MSNRVEELESKVRELQAAVNGLTEELVETKERLRYLESETGTDVTAPPKRRSRRAVEEDAETDVDADAEGDDVKSDGTQSEDERAKSDESDIIVA
jgi:hypothetical protein